MSAGYTKLRNCTRAWRRVLSPSQWALVCVVIDNTEGWQRPRAAISSSKFAEESNLAISTAKAQVRQLVSTGPLEVVGEVVVETADGDRKVKVYEVDYEWSPAAEKLEETENRRIRERAYKRTRTERKEEPLKRGRPRREPTDDGSDGDGRGLTENPQEDGARGLIENPRRGLNNNPQGGYYLTPEPAETLLANAESGGSKDSKESLERKTSLPSVGRGEQTDRQGWVDFKEEVEGMDPYAVSLPARELGDETRRVLARAGLDVPIGLLRCTAEVLGAEAPERMSRVALKNVDYAGRKRVDSAWKLFVISVWNDLGENPAGLGTPNPRTEDGPPSASTDDPLKAELERLDADLEAGGVIAHATAVLGGDGRKEAVAINARHARRLRPFEEGLSRAGWRVETPGKAPAEKGEVA